MGLGLLYAIIALGFMLILGTMEVINFSHGVLFALGGYAAQVTLSIQGFDLDHGGAYVTKQNTVTVQGAPHTCTARFGSSIFVLL